MYKVIALQMAKNAKVDALAVTYGMHSLEELLAHNPNGYIDTIFELPNWLKKGMGLSLYTPRDEI